MAWHSARAADSPVYGAVPDWVQQVSAPESLASDESPFKVLLSDQQIRLSPAGEETYTENMVRVQTSQGLQALGTLQIAWQPSTDTLTVHRVHLLRGGQVIDLLSGDTRFTLIRRENNLEYSALDGVLTAVLQPADLRVGDILDMAYSIKRNDPVLTGTSEAVLGGWVQVPYGRVHLRALWPKSFSVRWRATDDVKPVEEHDGQNSMLSYRLDSVEPPPQPSGAPIRFAVTRRVEFSSFTSWRDVSTRLSPLYVRAARIASGSPLQEELTKIKSASKDPIVRASAALRLVEDEIRYVYLGMNQAALVPADADTTWSRRFGDCKAKSVVLLALLHELGIEAEPVVVSSKAGDLVGGLLPSISAFDHVIVRARIAGRYYWLDGTRDGDRDLGTLRTPYFHWGLPLSEKGSELVSIVPEPLTEPIADTSVSINLTAGIFAPAPIHVVRVDRDDAGIVDRNQLAALTGDALDRALREFWSKQYPFVDVNSVLAKYDREAGSETLTMDGTAHLEWKDGWYETDGLGVGYTADFKRPKGADLTAPYAVVFPIYSRTREKIILPPGQAFTISGGNVNQTVAGMEVRRQVRIDASENAFYGEASERSLAQEFPAADSGAAQSALRAMAKDTVYLRKPDGYVETKPDLAADLAREPASADEYITRGNKFLSAKQYDQAIADFTKALALNPKAETALAGRGSAYAFQKNIQLATADFDAAEKLNPKDAMIWRGRGLMQVQAQEFGAAVAALSTALKLEPGNLFALTTLEYASESAGKFTDAMADANEVLRTQPNAHMYLVRANLYARFGQKELEAADAIQVVSMPDALAYEDRTAATMLLAVGRRAEAFKAYSQALEKDPQPEIFLSRAYARENSDLDGRIADADAALKLSPGMIAALSEKAHFQYLAGKFQEAALTSTAAMVTSRSPALLAIRAAAYEHSGEKTQSTADIQEARKLAEGNANLLNNLCWNLAEYGVAFADALAACDASLALSPNNFAALDSRAFVLLRLGRAAEAIAEYEAALKGRPNSAMSLYGKGLGRLRAGDAAGAQTDITAATALDSNVAATFELMGLRPN